MNKIFILLSTFLTLMTLSVVSNAQVTDMDKLKARKEVLKKTSELNELQIKLNSQIKDQQELQIDYEKAKSEVDIYASKNRVNLEADVKAAAKLSKLVKKSSKISSKITKNNIKIEKTKAAIEKTKERLNKLNGSVIIYTKEETPFRTYN